MRKHLVLLLLFQLALTLASAHAADKVGKYTALNMGTKSCGEVVKNFNERSAAKLNNNIWVAGYLTASNVAVGTGPKALDLWIFNYCKSNKNRPATLADAASSLVSGIRDLGATLTPGGILMLPDKH